MKPNKFKSRLYRKNNNTCHGAQLGWDYTPLFKYLLSKVGKSWDLIYKDIKPRLNTTIPIHWMVSTNKDLDNLSAYIRVGESAYFSTLYVDDKGLLQYVNKNINEHTLEPNCNCCTHTFNGKRFTKKYKEKNIIIIDELAEFNNKNIEI